MKTFFVSGRSSAQVLRGGVTLWRRRARARFTLIEMLVVIAIIGILAALLMPSLQKARRKGLQAACLNNQKQCFIGIWQYTQDWRDKLKIKQVRGGHIDLWSQFISGYANYGSESAPPQGTQYIQYGSAIFDCPDRPRSNAIYGKDSNDGWGIMMSVGAWQRGKPGFEFIETWLEDPAQIYGNNMQFYNLKKVGFPGKTTFLADSLRSYDPATGNLASGYREASMRSVNCYAPTTKWGANDWGGHVWFHHPGGFADLLFFDGHAAALDPFSTQTRTALTIGLLYDEPGYEVSIPGLDVK